MVGPKERTAKKLLLNASKRESHKMSMQVAVQVKKVLGGPWDLVTTYNWDYNPTYNAGNPCKHI